LEDDTLVTKEVDDPESVVLRKFSDEGLTMVNYFSAFSNIESHLKRLGLLSFSGIYAYLFRFG